jgi:hypothetical protein
MLELVEGGYIIGSLESVFGVAANDESGSDSIRLQMDNLTTSFIAQNVPTSRSALNINSIDLNLCTTSNKPSSRSALNINSINFTSCNCRYSRTVSTGLHLKGSV